MIIFCEVELLWLGALQAVQSWLTWPSTTTTDTFICIHAGENTVYLHYTNTGTCCRQSWPFVSAVHVDGCHLDISHHLTSRAACRPLCRPSGSLATGLDHYSTTHRTRPYAVIPFVQSDCDAVGGAERPTGRQVTLWRSAKRWVGTMQLEREGRAGGTVGWQRRTTASWLRVKRSITAAHHETSSDYCLKGRKQHCDTVPAEIRPDCVCSLSVCATFYIFTCTFYSLHSRRT